QYCGGVCHPVVGVGVKDTTVHGAGADDQAIVGLVNVGAEPGELGTQRGQPIGLVATDVGDAADGRRPVGQGGDRCHNRRQLGCVVQVDIDTGDVTGAVDTQSAVVVVSRLSAHCREDAEYMGGGLGGVTWPVGDTDLATGHEGS